MWFVCDFLPASPLQDRGNRWNGLAAWRGLFAFGSDSLRESVARDDPGDNAPVKKFPGCQFGPMQVRGALRADHVRGERVIGWATGRLVPEKSAELFMMGVMHIPGVGPLFAAAMMAKQARFLVLTDRRILILHVEKSSLNRVKRAVSIPLGEVAFSGWGKSILDGSMVVRAMHAEKSYTLQIRPRKKSRPWSRLVEGLRVLAADAEPAPSRLS